MLRDSTINPCPEASDILWATSDAIGFSRTILRHDLWPMQERILHAIASSPRVAVKAAHATGKTFIAADAVLWWLTCYPDGIVVTTAPTWTQVERVLWGAIHRAAEGSLIAYPPLNQTELRLGPGNFAIGLSTNEGVRFQGFHGRILVVIDEAPGVLPDIWQAIEGIRAGGDVHVLALGNPTVASGPFYDAFTASRAAWKTFTISAFDTPNMAGIALPSLLTMGDGELDANPRPYLVSRRWVREKYHEWGPGNSLWLSRVLGEFPTDGDDVLFPLSWLEAAAARTIDSADEDRWVAGLDVAGPGEDETALCVRHGGRVVLQASWANPDPRGQVVAALAAFRDRGIRVNVDSVGIGHYFAQHLKDCGFKVKRVNVGERAHDPERYSNLKAEIYWGFRQRLQEATLGGLSDPVSIAQLSAIRYEHNARGQIVIESKEQMSRRGLKSPDRAEALILAFGASKRLQPVDIRNTIRLL
jgi:hypothetical protein